MSNEDLIAIGNEICAIVAPEFPEQTFTTKLIPRGPVRIIGNEGPAQWSICVSEDQAKTIEKARDMAGFVRECVAAKEQQAAKRLARAQQP